MRLPNNLAAIFVVIACWGCAGSSIRPGARPQVAAVSPPATAPPTPAATPTAAATPAPAETPAPDETPAPAEIPAPTSPTTSVPPEADISVAAQETLAAAAARKSTDHLGAPSSRAGSKFETIFGLDAVVEDPAGCVDAPPPQSPSGAPTPCMRRVLPPDFVPSKHGDIDKNIVRIIIRSHIDEVKACYERELEKRPTLGGRVMVQFTISASGEVVASVLQNSTMGNAKLENCVVQAVRRWRFPKVLGGGIFIVSYPFVLTPAGPPGGPGGP